MNKEKEIEEMEKAIISANARVWEDGGDCYHAGEYREPTARERAERFINAGYGNIEQAVKEFAGKFKKEFLKHFPTLFTDAIYQCTDSELDNLITELYGADE